MLKQIFVGLFTFILVSTVYAGTQIVISAAPAPKQIISPPRGYVKCRIIPAGFHKGVWQQQHKVCSYRGNRNNGSWVSGYWKCVNFKPHNGVCVRWSWVNSHWENQKVVAYRSPPAHTMIARHAPPPPPRHHGTMIQVGPAPAPLY